LPFGEIVVCRLPIDWQLKASSLRAHRFDEHFPSPIFAKIDQLLRGSADDRNCLGAAG
jgi:hypothetical protein